MPIALYFQTGTIKYSFSTYHGTDGTYILMIGLLLVSISFMVTENITSGILLTGVALFNTYDYEITHNVFAISFFIYTTFLIAKDKRYGYLSIPVLIAAALIPYITLFWFECVGVLFFAIHSTLYSIKKLRLYKKKI